MQEGVIKGFPDLAPPKVSLSTGQDLLPHARNSDYGTQGSGLNYLLSAVPTAAAGSTQFTPLAFSATLAERCQGASDRGGQGRTTTAATARYQPMCSAGPYLDALVLGAVAEGGK